MEDKDQRTESEHQAARQAQDQPENSASLATTDLAKDNASTETSEAAPDAPIAPPPAQPSFQRFLNPRQLQHVSARTGAAFELTSGERLQIINQEGKQVCALTAVVRHDPNEYLSPSHTRSALGSLMLGTGDKLLSNRRNPLFTLEEDTVRRHDLLVPACDARQYLDKYGFNEHANCRDNLAMALAGYGVIADRLPDPVNFFMHVAILRRGQLEFREPLAAPNDYVVLRAQADLVVAVSACPQDQDLTNGYTPSDLLVRVFAD